MVKGSTSASDMIIQDLPLNQDNYTFSLEKAKPPTDGIAQEQTDTVLCCYS